jgi:hypothetical protein
MYLKHVIACNQHMFYPMKRANDIYLKALHKQSQADHSLFIKHSSRATVMAPIAYVNDIVVTANDNDI